MSKNMPATASKAADEQTALKTSILADINSAAPRCKVSFGNRTDASMGANVTGVVVEFTYDDGTTSRSSNTTLNMRGGDPPVELESEPKCVKDVHIVAKVQVAGESTIRLFEARDPADPGKCHLQLAWYLRPAKAVTAVDFSNSFVPLEIAE